MRCVMTKMNCAFQSPESGRREQVSALCRPNRFAALGFLGRNTVQAGAHAAYVGRVGGLAVALGVGAAVITGYGYGYGVASADTSGLSTSPSSSSDASSTRST